MDGISRPLDRFPDDFKSSSTNLSAAATPTQSATHVDGDARRKLALLHAGAFSWDWNLATDDFQCDAGAPGFDDGGASTRVVSSTQWASRVHADDRIRFAAALQACARGPSAMLDIKYRVNIGGDVRWLSSMGRTQTIDAARHLIGLTTDITASHSPEPRTFHQQRLASLGHMSSGIAHDFNNLLNVISNLAGVIRLQPSEPERQRLLDSMAVTIRRGAALTRKLMAFSRPEIPKAATVCPERALRDIEDLLTYSLNPGIDLRVTSTLDAWSIDVDPFEMQLALLNLVINARDAMPQGGVLTVSALNLVIGAEQSVLHNVAVGDYVVICVADTGMGMSEETLNHCTLPYFTTKAADRGTGLGLSQVAALASAAGGAVEIRSEVGRGTTVMLYLPRSVPALTLVATPAAQP